MIGVFLLSLLVGFSGAIVPGPLFAITFNQALSAGWTAGLWLSFGHMLAELVLLGVLRAGLGGVLQRPLTTRIIGLVGGVVLLYFAWGMIAVIFGGDMVSAHAATPTLAMNGGMLTGQGIVLTVLNPYWYLWWATIGVGLISAQASKHGPRAWPAFFIGHSLADYLWYVAVSAIIAFSGTFLSPSLHRGMIFVCGFGVATLGVVFIARQLLAWRHERTQSAQISTPGIDKH